jgi:hypothetical protein
LCQIHNFPAVRARDDRAADPHELLKPSNGGVLVVQVDIHGLNEIYIKISGASGVIGSALLREEAAFPGALMMSSIEVSCEHCAMEWGAEIYEVARSCAEDEGRRLLPMPDQTDDSFHTWLNCDPTALYEVFTHPAARALVGSDEGALSRFDWNLRAIVSYVDSPPRPIIDDDFSPF